MPETVIGTADMTSEETQVMADQHKLILRMISLVERNTALLESGKFRNWQFYLDAAEFIRNYNDRFHHTLAGDLLFAGLPGSSLQEKRSSSEILPEEQQQGSVHVRAMEEAAQRALEGEIGQSAIIIEHARSYAALLRVHIARAGDILFPLAERLLPVEVGDARKTARAEVPLRTPRLEEKYLRMVEDYENQVRNCR
jgi:hemerythrin-like domain-containing protein